MAAKSKSKSKRKTSTAKRSTSKAARPKRSKTENLRKAEPNPAPGPMPTNESLNPDSTKPELKVKHAFQPGEEVAFYPFSMIGVEQKEGREPMPSPHASATVLPDGTINTEGMGKGKWIMGGPAGYPLEDRFIEVTIK